jgi:hypothetical protein
MTQKVFVTPSNTAVFECPECKKSRTIDVEKFKNMDKEVRIRVNCSCGHSYPVVLERRRHYRRVVNLAGTYMLLVPDGPVEKKVMRVKDLSRSGLKIRLASKPDFGRGAKLLVEFRLDDSQRSLIKKEAIVRKISDQNIGLQFSSMDAGDPGDTALGFYLFS